MYLRYTFAAQSFGSDPSSKGGDLNAYPTGSALVLLLSFLALLSCILLLFLQTASSEKSTAHAFASSYQATLAAESGLATAIAQLTIVTSNNPTFLVGQTKEAIASSLKPVLLIGAKNLTNPQQLFPLLSGNLTNLADYPLLKPETLHHYLQAREETNKNLVVDLNQKGHLIASSGSYPAPWVILTNSTGLPIARYAYVFLDEHARINPTLHRGTPRTDPDNWNQGSYALPLSLGRSSQLLTKEDAVRALTIASNTPTLGCLERVFSNLKDYDAKKIYLTHNQVALPDLIPSSLPEGGQPKYDLNDLATNPIHGTTTTDRASNIASIIDRNLPHFKERDPSLSHLSPTEQRRYLNRLAACIVDYISPSHEPTLVNGGEPAGRNLFPLVTQTAERCAIKERTSHSVTIENQYFVQVWNPYTTPILTGATATFSLYNRQCLHFGTSPSTPFNNYEQTIVNTPLIRPNESVVLTFPSITQTWISPTVVPSGEYPRWIKGPESNADPTKHQAFEFYWNDTLIDMSRRPPVGPGPTEGGLDHDEQSLTNSSNFWQCNFIPTEQDHAGHFRFVGDPRENYLSNYLWKSYSSQKSYVMNTRWKGVLSDASNERLFSPSTTWLQRDFVPVNPVPGNKPLSLSMTPDQVFSSYREEADAIMAPFVLRNGPMNSIVELGHINDPAQADDLGEAPNAGSSDNKSSIYASGGGRTLRIGQPEFAYPNPNRTWNTPGKRAIELIDLFTVIPTNNSSSLKINDKSYSTNSLHPSTIWHKGLINVNTAPRPILTALFYGISPTSDRRFTNSKISTITAERLAALIEKHRPYEKLSDLHVITPLLANADTYTPSLSTNILSGEAPLAAVFDRAREEGFGKMIGLCSVQSRAFRVYILGQSLTPLGKANGETMMEATITLWPKENHTFTNSTTPSSTSENLLIPIVEEKRWLK